MALSRLATNDPAHRGIVTQSFGVVHVLITSQAAEHRLPEQPCQCVPTVLAGARVGERLACRRGQSECVVKLAVCNNPASDVTTDPRNCTIRRRSKSSRMEPDSDSPAGFAIAASPNPR